MRERERGNICVTCERNQERKAENGELRFASAHLNTIQLKKKSYKTHDEKSQITFFNAKKKKKMVTRS